MRAVVCACSSCLPAARRLAERRTTSRSPTACASASRAWSRTGRRRRCTSASRTDGQRWLAEMDQRLEKRIPDRQQRLELLRTVQYEATRARLDPQLVLGVIEVESGFRKYAVSRAGARGYMQVMPFWIEADRPAEPQPVPPAHQPRATAAPSCATISTSRTATTSARSAATTAASASPSIPISVLAAWRGRWKYDGPDARDRAGCSSATRASPTGSTASRRPSAARSCSCTGACTSCRRAWAGSSAARSLVLLVGSINYALSLGFALTFLLAGLGLAGMVHTARNLARIAVERGTRRAGVRRRVGAVPPLPRRPRRVRPAGDPRAPRRLGLAAGGRHPGRAASPRWCSRCRRRAAAGCRSGA